MEPGKGSRKRRNHGVSFFEACEIFDDEHSSALRDPDHSHDEDPYLIFGMSKDRKYLVVSYTERDDRI